MIRELELPRDEVLDTLDNPSKISGFVSPADDYQQRRLHIAQRIVTDPTNTFYFEAFDEQMKYYGIRSGSIIIVDRSIKARSGDLVVCYVESEWLTRRLEINGNTRYLCINDSIEGRINITGKVITDFGVVTWTCLPQSNQNGRVSGL